MLEIFSDLKKHNGFGEFSVQVRILKRGQKEIIICCDKQYRYVIDDNEQVGDEGSPLIV